MKSLRRFALISLGAVALCSYTVHADVRADEKSRVQFAGTLGRMFNLFGGKAAKEGVTSTVAVKGDRKATLNDTTGQIIDLDEGKIYDLDLKKKSYTVTTFAELRRRMEEARKKAVEDARKEEAREKKPSSDEKPKEVEVDFSVRNTGEKKTINGFGTHQAIMTIAVREKGERRQSGGIISPPTCGWRRIAAMKEVIDFDALRAKLWIDDRSVRNRWRRRWRYPMMKDAMARMRTESAKLDTAIRRSRRWTR